MGLCLAQHYCVWNHSFIYSVDTLDRLKGRVLSFGLQLQSKARNLSGRIITTDIHLASTILIGKM
jgi:hypothetical protein